MSKISRITTNHEEIKKWIERHEGKPAIIDDRDARMDKVGLRITFPGRRVDFTLSKSKPSYSVSWDEFFKIFDEKNLAFSYVDKKRIDDITLAFMFIPRQNV